MLYCAPKWHVFVYEIYMWYVLVSNKCGKCGTIDMACISEMHHWLARFFIGIFIIITNQIKSNLL